MLAKSQNGLDIKFLASIIDHYEERILDKKVPILVRAEFKRALAGYRYNYEELTNNCRFNHSINLLPCL